VWPGVALANPVVYEISGFRRSLCGIAEAIFSPSASRWYGGFFKTGYRLKRSSAASGPADCRSKQGERTP
jgi:hypothetical protein